MRCPAKVVFCYPLMRQPRQLLPNPANTVFIWESMSMLLIGASFGKSRRWSSSLESSKSAHYWLAFSRLEKTTTSAVQRRLAFPAKDYQGQTETAVRAVLQARLDMTVSDALVAGNLVPHQ